MNYTNDKKYRAYLDQIEQALAGVTTQLQEDKETVVEQGEEKISEIQQSIIKQRQKAQNIYNEAIEYIQETFAVDHDDTLKEQMENIIDQAKKAGYDLTETLKTD